MMFLFVLCSHGYGKPILTIFIFVFVASLSRIHMCSLIHDSNCSGVFILQPKACVLDHVILKSQFRQCEHSPARGVHPSVSAVFVAVYQRSSSGTIESPGYPERYPANKDCKWTLEAPVGHKITLRVSTGSRD